MADATLIVNGSTPIHLKLDNVYRIGRGEGYEIHIADQSVDVAHGSAAILRPGVVRFSALCGKIFVNGEEKSLTDVGKEDAFNGKDVKLRFGNVEAILEFKDDIDGLNTGSGFGECVQDKNDLTGDSFEIPETQPPPEDTSVNVTADSFYIPETQAVIPNRPSAGGNVSLGEDFMIPETQDVPLMVHNETTRCSDGSSSGSGSHIRICTQDFNDDAIDDFDSSLILGHPLMPLSPPKAEKRVENPEATHENLEASELEMTALNWSVSNSKCTALNSTNHQNEGHSGLEACLTPTLTGLSQDIHTPDLLDSVLCGGNKSYARQEEPAIPTTDLIDSSPDDARLSGSRSNASTPQLCGVKHLVVATIETPRPTPDEKEDNANREPNQDLIATQRFPGRKLIESDEVDEPVKEPNQDFIATQRFPGRKFIESDEEGEPVKEPNQDFIATQRFPGRKFIESDEQVEPNQDFIATQRFPGTNLGESDKEDQPTQANNMFKEPNQDFIATQRFPGLDLRESDDEDQPNQDFVPTQLFIPAPQGGNNQKSPECSNKNVSLNQDFIETQVFPTRGSAIQDKENIGSDDVSLKEDSSKTFQGLEPPYDEIDEVLNEMIAGTAMSPVDPREEQIKYFKPCVIKDKNHDLKVSQIEGVFKDVSNQSRWRNEPTNEVSRKRVARSVSPQATPGQKSRRLSEGSEWLELTPKRNIYNKHSEPSIAETEENTVEINTNSPLAEKETTKIVEQINNTSPLNSEGPEEKGSAKEEPPGRRRKCASSSSDELDITKPKRAKESPISEEPKMETKLVSKNNTLRKLKKEEKRDSYTVELQCSNGDPKICSPNIVIKLKRCNESTEPSDNQLELINTSESTTNDSFESSLSENPSEKTTTKPATSKRGTRVSKRKPRSGPKKESSLSIAEKSHEIPKSKRNVAQKAAIQKRITRLNGANDSNLEASSTASKASSEQEVEDVPKRRSRARSKAISEELNDITKIVQERGQGDGTNVPKNRSRATSKAKSSEPEAKDVPKRRSGGRSKAISEKVQEPSEGVGTNVPKSRARAKSKAKSTEPEVKDVSRSRSRGKSKAKSSEPEVKDVPKGRSRAKSKAKSTEPEVKDVSRSRSRGKSKAESSEPEVKDVPKGRSRAKSKAKSTEPEVKDVSRSRSRGKSKAKSSEPEVKDVPKRRSIAKSKAKSTEPEVKDVPKSRSRSKSKAKSSEPEVKNVPKRRSGGRSKAISEKVQEPSEADGTNVPKSRSRAGSRAKSQARSKAGVEESVKVAPPKRRNARSSSAKKSLDRSEAPSEAASTQTTLNNPNEISSEDGAKNKSRSTKGGARKGSAVPSSNKEEALADKKPKRGKAASKPEEPVAEKSNTLLKSTSEPLEASPAYNELSSTSAEPVKKPSKKDEEVATKPPPRASSMRLSMTPPNSLKAITQYIKQVRLDGKIKIVFSMCDRKPLERVLKSLQKVIEVTEDPLNCDLVIMDKGDRTYKFLVGVASNKPILSSSWLHSVRSSSCITVKEDHLFQDEKFEEKFKFRPISILESPRLLNGLTFFLRDGIQPNVKEMQAILECAGGIALLKRPPLSTIGEIFVVTTPQDLTSKNIMRDFETVHFILPEGIMQALLQHKQELLKDFPIKFKN